jgi:hypothetical protein
MPQAEAGEPLITDFIGTNYNPPVNNVKRREDYASSPPRI